MTETMSASPSRVAAAGGADTGAGVGASTGAVGGTGAVGASAGRPGALLAILLAGQFMAILDVSIVNVAAPTLRADLHTGGAGLQLVIAGYTAAYAMLLVAGARLGGRLGHRRVFLAGLALFSLASLACGLAVSTGLLIFFRLVQGAGAALMVPQVLSLIQRGFAGGARAKALGLYAAVIAGGAVVGQVAGGLLVSADLWGTGWRPIFLINVPIGAGLLVVGRRLLPRDAGRPGGSVDVPGLATLSAAVLLLVLPLVLGHEQHWPGWGWVAMGAGVLFFAGFAAVERRAVAPLAPGRVLRAPGMLPAMGAIVATLTAYAGFLFSIALHLQSGLGFSPLRAGLTFVPGAACFAVASLNWRRVPAHRHHRMVVAGLLLGAASFAVLGLSVRGGGHPDALFWLSQVCFGFGFGAAFSPMMTLALAHVAPADAADASGLLATLLQLAQVVGIATFGTLYLTLAGKGSADGGSSAHALAVTAACLAAAAVLAAASATRLPAPAPAPRRSSEVATSPGLAHEG
jgi:MFS family permease